MGTDAFEVESKFEDSRFGSQVADQEVQNKRFDRKRLGPELGTKILVDNIRVVQ
jgi:hypothetical protein